jgi:uridylate kinase
MFKRVVIKLSGEALSSNGEIFNDGIIDGLVAQIKRLRDSGVETALVIGGGNIWRGRNARLDMNKEKADQMGMLATVVNGIYICEAFVRQGVDAVVATPFPINTWTLHYEQEHVKKLMSGGTVVINAAGIGHPWFSTDTVTALRAAELKADAILFAKTTDGVYDKDPNKYADARKYRSLSYETALRNHLNVADMAAMHLAAGAGVASYVFSLGAENSISLAVSWPDTGLLNGTYVNNNIEEAFYVIPS